MVYEYGEKRVYYKILNPGKSRPIVLLHGWGVDSSIFENIVEMFSSKTFILIDLPPFGKSDKDNYDWNIFTYAGMLMSLCEHLKINTCDILAHSFGGRIALIVCSVKRSLVHTCILVDSAGMKPKHSIKYHLRVLKYKMMKKKGKDVSMFGSRDYRALSSQQKKLFNQIVNEYLEEYAKTIQTKTMIVWGENDNETPLYMAARLKRLIKNSQLEVIKSAGHFPFIENKLEFYKIVNKFWEDL